MVGGVSALRFANPICRYRSSKGLTFNPFALAGRWITAADRMIQNITRAPDEGRDEHDEGKEMTVRRWIEKRMALLIATYYAAAMARAIAAFPDDEPDVTG